MNGVAQTTNELARTVANPRIQVAALGATAGIVSTSLATKALFSQFRDFYGWEVTNGQFWPVGPGGGNPVVVDATTKKPVALNQEQSRTFNIRRQLTRVGAGVALLASLAFVKGDSVAAEGVRMGLITSAGTLFTHALQDNINAINP